MMKHNLARAVPRAAVALMALAIAPSLSTRAIAQESYPSCEPPDAGEYLLLVQGDVETAKAQLQEAFPEGVDVTVCTYIDSVITRVGGFSDAETATAWAQYLSDLGDLEAYVARPAQPAPEDAPSAETPDADAPNTDAPEAETEDNPPSPDPPPIPDPPTDAAEDSEPGQRRQPNAADAEAEPEDASQQPTEAVEDAADEASAFPSPTIPAPTAEAPPAADSVAPAEEPAAAIATTPVYDPQVLGDGYAVLVEYFDQPEVAANLQESLGRNIGLVAYNQQPYLLVAHTASGEEASNLLRDLSTDFTAVLVDGRNVVLISPAIAVIP